MPTPTIASCTFPAGINAPCDQALVGDSTDNYPGLPGCGPVNAEKILANVQPEESYIPHLQLAYAKAGLSFADLETQLNVARILMTKTYDFKKKKPIYWALGSFSV